MKKITLLILSMLILLPLSAALKAEDYRGFRLSAQKGSYREVSVEVISGSYLDEAGIPFYVTDSTVSYGGSSEAVSTKRRIATWSLHSNSAPVIQIHAPHLAHSNGTVMPYYLGFYYRFTNNNNEEKNGTIVVTSGTTYDSSKDTTCAFNDPNTEVVNFSALPVRFMLQNIDPSDDSYPYGTYTATVTISIVENAQ